MYIIHVRVVVQVLKGTKQTRVESSSCIMLSPDNPLVHPTIFFCPPNYLDSSTCTQEKNIKDDTIPHLSVNSVNDAGCRTRILPAIWNMNKNLYKTHFLQDGSFERNVSLYGIFLNQVFHVLKSCLTSLLCYCFFGGQKENRGKANTIFVYSCKNRKGWGKPGLVPNRWPLYFGPPNRAAHFGN